MMIRMMTVMTTIIVASSALYQPSLIRDGDEDDDHDDKDDDCDDNYHRSILCITNAA